MQTYDLSPELVGWVSRHKEEIRGKLEIGRLNLKLGKEQFMQEIIKTPQFLSQAWSHLIQVMEQLEAPAGVVTEAREVGPALSAHLEGKGFSDAEQAELSALVKPLEAARTNAEKLSILRETVQRGTLSKRLADRIVRLIPDTESRQATQASASGEPVIPMMKFNFGACGFCGFLGLAAGGPLAGAAACVFCGVLAR